MTVQSKKQLGMRIRQLRLDRHMSQEFLANMLEMDRGYICGIEQGKRNPSFEVLECIAEGFEMSLSALLWGVGKPGSEQSQREFEYARLRIPEEGTDGLLR